MNIGWDEKKSQLLKKKRGFSFEQVATLFSGITVERVKNDNPRQYLTIGFVEGQLMTLISEEHENEEGHFYGL